MSLIKKAQEELLLRKRFYEDFPLYARNCLSIRSKNQGLINLILNPAQQYIYDLLMEQKKKTGKIRAVILKGRQQGVSTEIGGLYYWLITHHRGFRAFILTHDSDATKNLYEMVRRYHENCPVLFRPEVGTDNANELNFPLLDSGYKIGTAGNKGVGRSSTIQLFHGSEVPRWPNAEEHAAGILQAIPNSSGTAAIFESTARGVGDYFHLMWQSAVNGSSEFMPIFIPFFWQKEYRAQLKEGFVLTDEEKELVAVYGLDHQQIQWRRNRIIELGDVTGKGEKLFKQEYPFNPTEAFLATSERSFIDSILVEKARKCVIEGNGPIVIGVDPAYKGEFSKDYTAIINRQGRRAYDLKVYHGYDTMQVTGLIVDRINKINPDKIFVDSVGIGVGIVDRLRELGYGSLVMPVNSASKAINDNRYSNKRAEIWGLMKEWLEDVPCQIPDDDMLHDEICSQGCENPDSKNRLVMQKKSELLKSPDRADALAFTFAYPVHRNSDYDRIYTGLSTSVAGLI